MPKFLFDFSFVIDKFRPPNFRDSSKKSFDFKTSLFRKMSSSFHLHFRCDFSLFSSQKEENAATFFRVVVFGTRWRRFALRILFSMDLTLQREYFPPGTYLFQSVS